MKARILIFLVVVSLLLVITPAVSQVGVVCSIVCARARSISSTSITLSGCGPMCGLTVAQGTGMVVTT